MWIKVCGITRSEDARIAAEAGADAIGFICWPGSPRYVDPEVAREIAEDLPGDLARVGVFVNASAAEIRHVTGAANLSHIQLHGDETPALADELAVPFLRAFRRADDPTALREQVAAWQSAFALMADGTAPGTYGGSGQQAADEIVSALKTHPRMVLAGGLTPDNVAERVGAVRPWGVDASSGLETAPGLKSGDAIRAFVEAARGVA